MRALKITVLAVVVTLAVAGAAVSAVARDKAAVATWTNPAGKEVTNHGKAVSAVARSDARKGGDTDKGRRDK